MQEITSIRPSEDSHKNEFKCGYGYMLSLPWSVCVLAGSRNIRETAEYRNFYFIRLRSVNFYADNRKHDRAEEMVLIHRDVRLNSTEVMILINKIRIFDT